MAGADQIVVFSDYVCPFCYLGKVSLQRYREEHPEAPEPVWRPFDLRAVQRKEDGTLDPRIPDGKDEAYFETAKKGVERLAEEYGVDMKVRVHREVDSFPAHLVAMKIERVGDVGDLAKWHDLVFDALWREGQDVGDLAVLRGLADKIGIEPTVVDSAMADEVLRGELERRLDAGRDLGVNAVPTFVYGNYSLPGAVPPETIEALVTHVRKGGGQEGKEAG